MSSCVKDLYDYDLIKNCCGCKSICLESNFYESKNTNDGLHLQCISCSKIYYNENRETTRKYYLENRDNILKNQLQNRSKVNTRMNEYNKNRVKTDVIFRLIRNKRRRIDHALNGKLKSSSTRDFLGVDIDLYRKWIEWQFTPEMTWDNTENDHVNPICLFDVSKDEELKEAFSWKNTRPLLKHDPQQKGTKFYFLDYQLQFIEHIDLSN